MRLPSGAWDMSIARSLSVAFLWYAFMLALLFKYRIILLRECSACPNSDRFPQISYCMRAGKRATGTCVIAGASPFKKKKKKKKKKESLHGIPASQTVAGKCEQECRVHCRQPRLSTVLTGSPSCCWKTCDWPAST